MLSDARFVLLIKVENYVGRECHDRALAAHKRYLSDGVLTDDLLLGAIYLARIDQVYRDGPEYLRREWFTAAYPREMADLRRLYEIVPREKFQSRDQCFLNPTFDLASEMVERADADVILDDCLIDIKTTKYLRFKVADLHQIVGYYILCLLSGKSPSGIWVKSGAWVSISQGTLSSTRLRSRRSSNPPPCPS